MNKSIVKKVELIDRVEELMLRGIQKPSLIVRAISGIKDARTAENYIKAVKNKWALRTLDLEETRKKLIMQSENSQAELEVRAMEEEDNKTFSSLKGASLREREEQKKLCGLDEKRITLEQGNSFLNNLSEEERHQKMVELLPDEVIKKEHAKRFGTTLSSGDRK